MSSSRSGRNPFSNLFSHAFSSSSRIPQLPPPEPSPPPEPPRFPPPPPPSTSFLCPLCSFLMPDPILTYSGHSFDRLCLQACQLLRFIPPNLDVPSGSLSSPQIPLIPNLDLKDVIHAWCQYTGHPLPVIHPDPQIAATHIARTLHSMPFTHPVLPDPPPFRFDVAKEEEILKKLNKKSALSKDSGLNGVIKNQICSPKILAALIGELKEPTNGMMQKFAARVLCSLSVNKHNRAHILRSGAVHALLALLNGGKPKAYKWAARSLCVLSSDETYCLAIGAVGAIRPLLDKLCGHFCGRSGWKVVARTLYNLAEHSDANREAFLENEGVGRLIGMAEERSVKRKVRRHALGLVLCLVRMERGRDVVLGGNGGRLKALLKFVNHGGEGVSFPSMMVMYRVCRLSMQRFREVGRIANVATEAVLLQEKEDWGQQGKEMARAMVRVMREEITEAEQLDEIVIPPEKEVLNVEVELKEKKEKKMGSVNSGSSA